MGHGLDQLNFNDEIIFWYKRMLAICVCNKDERCEIYLSLMKICNRREQIGKQFCGTDQCTKVPCNHFIEDLEKDEMVLVYGQKLLDMNFVQNKMDNTEHLVVLYSMTNAAIRLRRLQDIMKLLKEKLKIHVIKYNNGQLSDKQLLGSYAPLIESQIQNKCFIKALKTYKHIKLFGLNSLEPDDVLASLEAEGYKKYFPQSIFNFEEDESVLSNSILELNKKQKSLPKKYYDISTKKQYNDFLSYIGHIMTIGDMCTLKCMIFKGLNDLTQCRKWTRLPCMIYNDVLFECMNMKDCIPDEPEITETKSDNMDQCSCGQRTCPACMTKMEEHCTAVMHSYVKKILTATLTLSVCDPSKRREFFDQLIIQIMSQAPSLKKFIGAVVKESNIPFEDVTPFLEYCIDYCSKQEIDLQRKKDIPKPISFKGQQKDIVTYKNSLHIIKYFEKLCCHDEKSVQNIGYTKV